MTTIFDSPRWKQSKMKFIALLVAIATQAVFANTKMIWDVRETPVDVVWGRVLQQYGSFVDHPEPTLINGTVPNMKDFPATSFTGSCTITAVGERVAIIAAHCTSGSGNLSFPIGPSKYSATCTDSKDYASNATSDYSLCKTTKPIEGIVFENVNLDKSHVSKGDKILLGGYGCTDEGGQGGIDGLFRIGVAEIVTMPSGNSCDIVTKNGAALCFGDSGGAVFSLNPDGTRNRLIAINSRGDIATTSYLSATHTDYFARFIKSWAAANPDAKICGYNSDAAKCRGAIAAAPVSFETNNGSTACNFTVQPGRYKAEAVQQSLKSVGF